MRARVLGALLMCGGLCMTAAGAGTLLWDDVLDTAGDFGWAEGLAVKGSRLFVTGRDTNGAGDTDLVVRAYAAKTGTLLWSEVADEFGADDAGEEIVAQGRRVFVAGVSYPMGGVQDWHVRAHDGKSGALLWKEVLDTAGGRDIPIGLAARGKTLVVVGRAESGDGDDDARVRAYDVRTGAVQWNDLVDEAGEDDEAEHVVIKGRTALTAGFLTPAGGDSEGFLRAYDLATGALRWEQRIDPASGDDIVAGLALKGRRLFTTIRTDSGGLFSARLEARDAKTGALLWGHPIDAGGDQVSAGAVVVKGSRVCATSWAGADFNGADWLVVCRHAKTGDLLWTDRYDSGGRDLGGTIAVAGGVLVVAGDNEDGFGGRDYHVRAYDLRDGTLRWEDVVPGTGDDAATAAATKGTRVFLGGFIESPPGNKNWVVRAYRAK